jgi:hypothetical protein
METIYVTIIDELRYGRKFTYLNKTRAGVHATIERHIDMMIRNRSTQPSQIMKFRPTGVGVAIREIQSLMDMLTIGEGYVDHECIEMNLTELAEIYHSGVIFTLHCERDFEIHCKNDYLME